MTKKIGTYIIVILIAIALIWILPKILFLSSILQVGQYNSNSDCSFITNVDYGLDGEQITDYAGPNDWIAVDLDKNGAKEGYGIFIVSVGGPVCDKEVIAYTPIGFKVIKYSSDGVAICSGELAYVFKTTSPYASEAILSCGSPTICSFLSRDDTACMNNPACVPGFYGCIDLSTATCDSINGGNINGISPCTKKLGCAQNPLNSEICSISQCFGADLDCNGKVSFTEFIAYGSKWKSGQATFTQLIQAASAWKTG